LPSRRDKGHVDRSAGRLRTRKPSVPWTRAARPLACGRRGAVPSSPVEAELRLPECSPWFSLRSPAACSTGRWSVERVLFNDCDFTSQCSISSTASCGGSSALYDRGCGGDGFGFGRGWADHHFAGTTSWRTDGVVDGASARVRSAGEATFRHGLAPWRDGGERAGYHRQ